MMKGLVKQKRKRTKLWHLFYRGGKLILSFWSIIIRFGFSGFDVDLTAE